MSEQDTKGLEFFGKSAAVVFTGILGTGGILGLKDDLVRDGVTATVFWLCVAGFALAALSGAAITLQRRAGFAHGRRGLTIMMLLGSITGILCSGVLATLRNWR